MIGTFPRRCWVIASMAVICARIKADVNMTSTGMLLILFPASIASSIPFLLRGTSTHPVNKFFSFHNDSPCRIRIKAASFDFLLLSPALLLEGDNTGSTTDVCEARDRITVQFLRPERLVLLLDKPLPLIKSLATNLTMLLWCFW
ncbi:hypothetical protein V8G54_005638 [Vigna mungo]|uniref:Uncharacterized protein n=1 Tax=Vigna mungo TaxID=3915 RepID=A0AAQ3S789_VIGMU